MLVLATVGKFLGVEHMMKSGLAPMLFKSET